MPDEPELASAEEVAALRAKWLDANQEYKYTPKTHMPDGKSSKYGAGGIRGKWSGFEQVTAEYRASEEKRKESRPWFNKPAEARKKRKLDAEDKHFERVFKEKFEDPKYYGVR